MRIVYIFCFFSTFLFGQEIVLESNTAKITYRYESFFSPIGDYDIHLYATDSVSQFVHIQKKAVFKPKPNYQFDVPFFKYINNFNFLTNLIEENRVLRDSTVLYSRWKNDLIWEITDEEKTIGNYKVRKATTDSFESHPDDTFYSRKAIAWFTTDIPLPLGPCRYYGLPGLIIELGYERSNVKYVLKDIDFQADYKFIELNKENQVDKFDVIYFNHENPKKIKEIQKENKRKKKMEKKMEKKK